MIERKQSRLVASRQLKKRYLVSFFKSLVSPDGHPADVSQGAFEILAGDRHQAALLAQRKFCERRSLSDWRLHADRFEVSETEFPS